MKRVPAVRRWWSGLLLFCCSVPALHAQDVFLGGSLDIELGGGARTSFELGRDAGIGIAFETVDATVNYQFTVAGARGRVVQFYALLPYLRDVQLAVGRVLAPFGSPGMEPLDKYVAGAPDLFEYFRDYRRGNLLLDTFVDGLWAHWQPGKWRLDMVGGIDQASDEWNLFSRASRRVGKAEMGLSYFVGASAQDLAATSVALDGSWPTSWGEVRVEPLWGRRSGMEYGAGYAEVRGYWDRRWEAGMKGAVYDPEDGGSTSTVKWFVRRWDSPAAFWELRYELNDAPGDAGDDQVVLRYRVEF